MKKAKSSSFQLPLIAILIASCTAPANQPRPGNVGVSSASSSAAPAGTNPTASPNGTTASPRPGSSSAPAVSPSAIPAGITASLSPTTGGSVEITSDEALRQQLLGIVGSQISKVSELPAVSAIASEHARQLAANPKDAEFKVAATYDPVPPGGLLTRLLQAKVFPSDNLVNAYLADGSPEQVRDRFTRQLQGVVGPVPFSHFGIGVARRGGSWFVSLILLSRILEIDNLPLTFASTGTHRVTGRVVLSGYSNPRIVMTKADGSVQTVEARVSGSSFEADLPLDQTGLYSFEVNVTGPLGPLPATNFILAVGVPYPQSQPLASEMVPIGDLETARNQLLELVNRDRQAMGQRTLQRDPLLDQAAQSHSDDMVANGFIGHNSPTAGTPQQQAAASGVTELVSQNLAVSRSLNNSQRELMSSPGHRKTILEPNHTHVGFGVKASPDGFLYITQLFIQRKVALEPLPKTIRPGQSFTVRGKASANGNVGAFLGEQLLGNFIPVQAGQSFELPVTLSSTGKQRLRIGFAEGGGASLFFTFYNIWDIEVQ